MTIGFEFCYCEHFTLTAYTFAGTEIDKGNFTTTLDTAIEMVKELLYSGDYEQVCATNRNTGEIIFIARAHDDDCVEEIDDDPYDIDWDDHYYDNCDYDCGFDPYLGCFTDDC